MDEKEDLQVGEKIGLYLTYYSTGWIFVIYIYRLGI